MNTNSSKSSAPRAVRDADGKDGVFGTWASLWLGMIESTVRTATQLSRAILGEGSKAFDAAIDFGEATQASIFRVAREANRATLDIATDAVGRVEDAALVVLRVGQETGDRAAELAAQTSHAVVGSRGLAEARKAA